MHWLNHRGDEAELFCEVHGGYDAPEGARLLTHGGAPQEVLYEGVAASDLGKVCGRPADVTKGAGPTNDGAFSLASDC